MTRKALLSALVFIAAAVPARAVTLVDNGSVKVDMEARLMFWAAYTGPDLIPGTNSAPPPAQEGHDRKIQFDHGTVTERPNDLDDNFYRLSVVAVF